MNWPGNVVLPMAVIQFWTVFRFFKYEKSLQVQWSCQGCFDCSSHSVFAFENNVIELKAEDYLHVYMSLLCPYKRQTSMLSFLSLKWELGTLTTQVKRHYVYRDRSRVVKFLIQLENKIYQCGNSIQAHCIRNTGILVAFVI